MASFYTIAKPVLSPCIGTCHLDSAGLCEGCHRNADEIAHWLAYSDEQRRKLMNEVLPLRAQQRPA